MTSEPAPHTDSLEEPALPSLTCPRCGVTSYNVNDVEQSYCGRCHLFLLDPVSFAGETMPTADLERANRLGYYYVRTLSDGRFLAVELALWDQAYLKLCSGDDPHSPDGVDDVWLYERVRFALHAAITWDPAIQKEPFGWYRHPQTGRRRPHGNPRNEYVGF